MKRSLLTLCSLALLTPAFAASVKDLEYTINYYSDTITIKDCDYYASGDLIIPATIDGKKVTEIGERAFEGCSSLTSVTIPEGVTTIGEHAFSRCSRLTSLTIPSSVTKIGSFAFCDCSSLTSVTIPEGVTEIGSYAFRGCSSLTSVTIPEGVTSIGDDAFSGCSNLTSVTIPESVTTIGESAFFGCSSLTSVTIPESVTTIGGDAFYGCSSLTSVTIPSSVTTIGESAFSGCTEMKEMIFKGLPPHVVLLSEKDKKNLNEKYKGLDTLPTAKGYYLPEYAEVWDKIPRGETGRWNNLLIQRISEEALAELNDTDVKSKKTDVKGDTISLKLLIFIILGMLGSFIVGSVATAFIRKKK